MLLSLRAKVRSLILSHTLLQALPPPKKQHQSHTAHLKLHSLP
jgi:hypothetical protein